MYFQYRFEDRCGRCVKALRARECWIFAGIVETGRAVEVGDMFAIRDELQELGFQFGPDFVICKTPVTE